MQPKPLSHDVHATPQLTGDDIREAHKLGYRTIVNNRPDGEEPGQPTSAELSCVAAECGLAYLHIPVTGDGIDEDKVDAFRRGLEDCESPALGFCRTGTRTAMLWALTSVERRGINDVLSAANAAGYDLEKLRPRLEKHAMGTR